MTCGVEVEVNKVMEQGNNGDTDGLLRWLTEVEVKRDSWITK